MKSVGRIIFVIALIISGGITWLNLSWKSLEQLTNSPSESRIDYYLSDFTLMKTDKDGNIRYSLTGRHLTHKQASGASEIYQPHIIARSKNSGALTVTSEKALQKAKDGNITLSGKIHVQKPASADSPEFTLTTENLTYNPHQQLISTDADIRLISTAGTLHGTGFETRLDEQELRILSNVQAEFHTTQ